MNRKLAPKDVTSPELLVRMPRDNFDVGDYWIMLDGDTVAIRAQKLGAAPTERIDIPRKDFNKMVRWWTRPVTVGKAR